MVNAIQIIIIAMIFIFGAILIKRSQIREKKEINKYKRTRAKIERTIYSDTGNAKYYVSFVDDGKVFMAQTNHYSSKTKSLNPGDEVEIGYLFTKRDVPRAVIFDERIIPVSLSVPRTYKLFFIIGIALLIIGCIVLIQNI